MPLLLSSMSRRLCAPGPVLPPADDFVLVNSRTGFQFTAGASVVGSWVSGYTWGGGGGTISPGCTMLYRNVIVSTGDDLGSLSVVETRDFSTATKAGWFDAVGNWASDGTDCTCTFPNGLTGGISPHDEEYTIVTPKRAARGEFAFTLSADFQGHTVTNKLMWLYVDGVGRIYIDLNSGGNPNGPYTLNVNVQSVVSFPGAEPNYPPNIVPGAAIERGQAVTIRWDVLANTNAAADGETHIYYKAA